MKGDEILFFQYVYNWCSYQDWQGHHEGLFTVREMVNIFSSTGYIHHKRCWYLLQKWARLGFYDYGTTLDLGWLRPSRLPDRYKQLLT